MKQFAVVQQLSVAAIVVLQIGSRVQRGFQQGTSGYRLRARISRRFDRRHRTQPFEGLAFCFHPNVVVVFRHLPGDVAGNAQDCGLRCASLSQFCNAWMPKIMESTFSGQVAPRSTACLLQFCSVDVWRRTRLGVLQSIAWPPARHTGRLRARRECVRSPRTAASRCAPAFRRPAVSQALRLRHGSCLKPREFQASDIMTPLSVV